MDFIIKRTNSENHDFINLVTALDAYLKITDGDEHDFYNQFNGIDNLKHVVVFFKNDVAVGCGAIKKFEASSMEIKRMFVKSEFRGKKIAQKILQELENWTTELGCKRCVLETGKRQLEAVKFYKKCGYKSIPKYGQYISMENSLCFEKVVK